MQVGVRHLCCTQEKAGLGPNHPDSRLVNRTVESMKYVMPTTDEIAYDLNGSVLFSQLVSQQSISPDSCRQRKPRFIRFRDTSRIFSVYKVAYGHQTGIPDPDSYFAEQGLERADRSSSDCRQYIGFRKKHKRT